MHKSISKGAWNSDVDHLEDSRTETRRAEDMERRDRSRDVPAEEDELLVSIDRLMEEVEVSLTQTPSSSESEDTNWDAIWEALRDQIDLETEVKFVSEDYERVQQDIQERRKDMERLLQQIREAKEQQSQQPSEDEDSVPDREDSAPEPPRQDASKDQELPGSSRGRKPPAAEPHQETSRSELPSEEEQREERPKPPLRLEAELLQEKMRNKAVQEELEKVRLSCADEIHKYKVQLQNVRQQLESLQHVHQKDVQKEKALKEQSELSRQEVKKAKAELQSCREELKDCKHQCDLLQRNLRRAQESSGKAGAQVPLELQACQKDLNTLKQQMDSFRKNPRWDLQSPESSLFMTGSTGVLSSKSRGQNFTRGQFRSLQSELEKSRKETLQEKELCERLQREKESIQMSYKEQQNELSYTRRHFDSMQTQLEDYKKRYESKTEEANHLRKDLKKVKKSCKKKHDKTRSKTAEEDAVHADPSHGDKKKRRLKDDRPEGTACAETSSEKKSRRKQQKEPERKQSPCRDSQTSPESHRSSRSPQKSTLAFVRDFLGLRKIKK